eukprot:993268-Amphidinium_carterae.1
MPSISRDDGAAMEGILIRRIYGSAMKVRLHQDFNCTCQGFVAGNFLWMSKMVCTPGVTGIKCVFFEQTHISALY